MTGAQVREARRLLGWSAERLNAVAGLPAGVVERYEKTCRIRRQKRIDSSVDRLAELRGVLELAGVVFTDGDDAGLGVRLRSSREA